jgi:hypothetical protein
MTSEERQAARLNKLIEYIDEILLLYWESGYGVDIVLGSQPDEWGFEIFKKVQEYYKTEWSIREYLTKELAFGIVLSDPEDGFISPQNIIYIEGITRRNDPFEHFKDPRNTPFTLISQPSNWEED